MVKCIKPRIDNFLAERWLSWSKALDSKSNVGQNLTVGSNPTLSAIYFP